MAIHFASVRAVVFDAVGTLIYPDPPVADVYHRLGATHGSDLTKSEIAQNFKSVLQSHHYQPRTNEQIERERWRQIVADVFTDLDDTESLFGQLWDHFARASSWTVYDDVAEVLSALDSSGLITAIGSNFDARLLAIVQGLSPLEQTRQVFVSSQLGFTKPSIEFFRSIEAHLQLRPDQLLMVGDDLRTDIEGANIAGWHSLLLNRTATATDASQIRSIRKLKSFWN